MKHLFTLLLGISFTTLVAQDFRYGKISKEEVLSEKVNWNRMLRLKLFMKHRW